MAGILSACRDPPTCAVPVITCCEDFSAITVDHRNLDAEQLHVEGRSVEVTRTVVDAEAEEAYLRRLEVASRLAREEERRQEREEKERSQQEKQEQAARLEAKEASRKERDLVAAFLQAHGYEHVNAKKRIGWFTYRYPLHQAVENNDHTIVALLLRAGAEKGLKDSSGRTPAALALKRDKNGSHEQVLTVLKLQPGN